MGDSLNEKSRRANRKGMEGNGMEGNGTEGNGRDEKMKEKKKKHITIIITSFFGVW